MHPNATRLKQRNPNWAGPLLAGVLLLALFSGCASLPSSPPNENRRALRSIPQVPNESSLRANQALVTAFFAANGISITPAQAQEISPASDPFGRIDRNAIRRIATKNKRLLVVINADPVYLWEELGNNLPLLVLLPTDTRYNPTATPLIPVAWDVKKHTLDLLQGNGKIQTLPEEDFFTRREPLKHAALCLIKPNGLHHFEPTREQKLLLADFWFDQSFYRRTTVAFTPIQETTPTGVANLDDLLSQGSRLIRTGRYRDAIPVFRSALALDPDNPKILNNLAYCMLNGRGELMIALRHAHKAAQLDPDNPLILETLGSINLHLGDATAAAKYLEQAWARALKRSPEVQIAIMDQLVRAWLAADREDLAWQVAEYRHRNYPEYRFPKDILNYFPALKRAAISLPNNI